MLGELHDAFIGTIEQLRGQARERETHLLQSMHLHVAEMRAELRAAERRAKERYKRIYRLLVVSGRGEEDSPAPEW